MNIPDDVLRAIAEASSILITTHVIPDGDAIGSMLGMKMALEQIGLSPVAAISDPVPASLRFLPGAGSVLGPEDLLSSYGVALVLDCGDIERVGRVANAVRGSAAVVNVDHHATNDEFGTYNWVDTQAAATAELAAQIIRALGVEYTPEIAACLYAGISTDTGSFRYSNTRAATLRTAAELIEAGARPWEIAQNIYDSKPYGSLAALAEVILGIEFSCDGLLASMNITAEIMAKHGVSEGDTEGYIGYARSVAGVEAAVAFREAPDGLIRIGFRSKEKVDVARVASDFGGGGHVRASGCTVPGPLPEARSKVMLRLRTALREAGYTWTE